MSLKLFLARRRSRAIARILPSVVILSWFATSTETSIAAERGRDPWVFRMIFENRSRMLVMALRSDLWAAYNPANGSLYKVWNGGIEYHGKVYDFGQRNSKALGQVYHRCEKSSLLEATDESVIPSGWTTEGIATGAESWTLTNSNSELVTRSFDTRRYDQVMVTYRTPGGNNRLLVDVSTDNGLSWNAQTWMSIDAPAEDGHQKRLAVTAEQVKLRFRRNTTGSTATLADLVVMGDYQVWSFQKDGQMVFPKVDWRGYRLSGQTDGVTLLYDLILPDETRISVAETPEQVVGAGMTRKFEILGLPADSRVSLELDGTGYQAAHQLAGAGSLRTENDDTFLDFVTDGSSTLTTTWTP
ncbi:hypothetical protein JIN85_06935 [Luteolibacter pohnpeiensis]|uniref:Uncharacterized protein n=1 Tax=Luteolibacter pohnpeiensis TaxID=454153 RepID=A0A934VQJ0_9BACT|nr:hypothetical protein [Luteolibacter pohnpeiensis]MBK1882141.1 hypothetical protein [Luteolibacter pohnpeiensis]